MPVLSKRFSERNKTVIALVCLAALVGVSVLAFNAGTIVRSFDSDTFTAEFSEAGGLRSGAEVRLGGYDVGRVLSVELVDDRVVAEFTVQRGGTLGRDTRAAIKTATPLGLKFLQVLPSGPGELADGDTIGLDRTTAPYDVAQVLGDLTGRVERLDTGQLATSLTTVADTFRDTPPELREALRGVGRISETVASRDQELRALLSNAAGVTQVLADRNQQLQQIFTDGNLLLAELLARRDAIRSLLINATRALDQVEGLVRDNQDQLGPALRELQGVTDLLIRNERAISASITGLNNYAGALGEGVGGGPWFFAYIPNLIPANLLPSIPALLGVPDAGSGAAGPGAAPNLPGVPR